MNRASTHFLRAAVLVIGFIVLTIIGLTLSAILKDEAGDYEPVLFGMYVAAIPFYIALAQTIKLLNLIDRGKAFSRKSARALRKVRNCALSISILYTILFPVIFYVADNDDAPGVVALALLLIGTSLVIATSAGVLQKLLEKALEIKSENDLTV